VSPTQFPPVLSLITGPSSMTSSPISLPSSPTRHKSHSALPSPGPPMVRLYSLVSPTTSSGSGSLLLRDHVDYEFTCEDIIVLCPLGLLEY